MRTRATDHLSERVYEVLEERAYEAVGQEIEAGQRSQGLWLKAIAESGGDEAAARALYLRYRARVLLAEAIETRGDFIDALLARVEQLEMSEHRRSPAVARETTFLREVAAEILAGGLPSTEVARCPECQAPCRDAPCSLCSDPSAQRSTPEELERVAKLNAEWERRRQAAEGGEK